MTLNEGVRRVEIVIFAYTPVSKTTKNKLIKIIKIRFILKTLPSSFIPLNGPYMQDGRKPYSIPAPDS